MIRSLLLLSLVLLLSCNQQNTATIPDEPAVEASAPVEVAQDTTPYISYRLDYPNQRIVVSRTGPVDYSMYIATSFSAFPLQIGRRETSMSFDRVRLAPGKHVQIQPWSTDPNCKVAYTYDTTKTIIQEYDTSSTWEDRGKRRARLILDDENRQVILLREGDLREPYRVVYKITFPDKSVKVSSMPFGGANDRRYLEYDPYRLRPGSKVELLDHSRNAYAKLPYTYDSTPVVIPMSEQSGEKPVLGIYFENNEIVVRSKKPVTQSTYYLVEAQKNGSYRGTGFGNFLQRGDSVHYHPLLSKNAPAYRLQPSPSFDIDPAHSAITIDVDKGALPVLGLYYENGKVQLKSSKPAEYRFIAGFRIDRPGAAQPSFTSYFLEKGQTKLKNGFKLNPGDTLTVSPSAHYQIDEARKMLIVPK